MANLTTLDYFLILLRVAFVFSNGYIHPDEFFQSQEIMAGHIFGIHSFTPWEFSLETEGLSRSIVPVLLSCGIPLKLCKVIGTTSAYTLFVAPRIFLLLVVSFSSDLLLYKICKLLNLDSREILFIHRSSWITLVFLSRPFSNTLETLYVYLIVWIAVDSPPKPYLLGVITAFGCFSRITFPAFVLPTILFSLYENAMQYVSLFKRKTDNTPAVLMQLKECIFFTLKSIIGFSLCCLFHVIVDTIYVLWRNQKRSTVNLFDLSSVVVAPWNNLLYNLKSENLAIHGVHPRYFHLLVNMQLLFSPYWFVLLFTLIPVAYRGKTMQKHEYLMLYTILFALSILSLFPHQEARFLLPLLLPISVLYGSTLSQCSNSQKFALRGTWTIFNLVVSVFFGILHQGGLIRLLMRLNMFTAQDNKNNILSHTPNTTDFCVVTYETYMSPRFLLKRPLEDELHFFDLGGANASIMEQTLTKCTDWLLLVPASAVANLWHSFHGKIVDISQSQQAAAEAGECLFTAELIEVSFPHFSGEALPKSLSELSLLLYRLSSTV